MAKNANMNNMASINTMNNPNTNMNLTNPTMNQNMAMANMNTTLQTNSAMNSNSNMGMNMNSNQNTLNSNSTQNQTTGEVNKNMYNNMANNIQNKNPQNFTYGMNNIPSGNNQNNNQISSIQQQPAPISNNPNNMTIPPMMPRYPYPMMNSINHMNAMRPMMYPNNPMINPMMNQLYQQPNQMNTNNPQQNSSHNIKEMINDAISKLMSPNNDEDNDLSSINDDSQSNFEKDFSLEEENLKNIWGGFLTKNKKDRVCVDAYQIRNECSEFLNNEYNLNVSHRTQADDIVKRPIIGITAFSPQNATQCDIFQDYINYFNEKNRVGVINLKNQMILYLVPPCEFSRKFYQNPKKHLLGIFVNSTAEPKSYVDLNNLSLPPPVISLTEKRQLLKQQKRNSSSSKVVSGNSLNQVGGNSQESIGELTKLLGNLEQDKLGNIIHY